MMQLAELRDFCLSLPGAFEDRPFGPETSVIKIDAQLPGAGRRDAKLFALYREDQLPLRVNLKCEPALAEQLRAAHPEITPGYHMNKKHWNTVSCSGALPNQTIRDLIEDSYDLVVSSLTRIQQEALGWRGLVERGSND